MAARKSKAVRTLERAIGGPLTFGGMLTAIRLGEELSLSAFAAQLGVSRHHLCDVERGRRLVSPERAAAWADKLGYNVEQFVQLALQASLDAANVPLSVTVSASHPPSRRV